MNEWTHLFTHILWVSSMYQHSISHWGYSDGYTRHCSFPCRRHIQISVQAIVTQYRVPSVMRGERGTQLLRLGSTQTTLVYSWLVVLVRSFLLGMGREILNFLGPVMLLLSTILSLKENWASPWILVISGFEVF